MGMLGANGLNSAINKSPLYGCYEDRVDRESAYEKLLSEGFVAHGTQQPIQQEQPAPVGSGSLLACVNEFLFGSTGPRGGKRDVIVQTTAKSMARDLGCQILRGAWDSVRGGRRK